jgi:hypothetical protein
MLTTAYYFPFSVEWTKDKNGKASVGILVMFQIYRCIILLNDGLNKAFGQIFVPLFKLLLIYSTLIATFVVIKLREVVPFYIYGLFICYTFTIFLLMMPAAMFMSTMYNLSSQFRRKILLTIAREGKERETFKKILQAFPIVKSKVGAFYVMEGYAKLTLIDTITKGISTLLITFQHMG